MRFSDFLLVSDPSDLDFIVGYTEEQNIRINVSDFFGNQIEGSGNPGYIPVFTDNKIIANSQVFQDGANIVIGGVNAMGYRLAVGGSLYALGGTTIESSIPGSNTFKTIGEEGDSFIIPHDSSESIQTVRTIIHAPAVLDTESATLGQVNSAILALEGDIDILLDLKVDKTSVGAPNGVASLDATGKVPLSEIPDSIIGQVEYMGTWDALTNTPTLNPFIPEQKGHYYVVSVAGVFGGIDYQVGDWIISNGVIWEKVDNTDAVTSVFGRLGAILALEGDYQAFYPRLSQAYDNPTWINSLAFTKITGVPPFLLENQTITLSGDVTGSGKTSIASTISDNVVTNSKLRDSVGTSVIGRAASSAGDPGDIQASTDGYVLQRSGGALLFGLISSDSIGSIDWSKIINTPTTLSGYGITDAYTKTEADNKFVPYTGANANVNLGSNSITANSLIKAGGTSSQFLKADGSVDSSQYVPTTRSVNAGTGLTGGGNLSSDITIAFDTTWGDNRYAYRTRQLTINGTTYDLSADRTWSVGTVTSVGLSAPTGFSVSNSPVTTSGTLSLSFATGYSLPTSASQITWDTAYNNSIVSASVTGAETKLLTLTQQDGGTITASWSDFDTAPVTSVFGRLGAIIAQSGDYTTTLVTEGTNLYFTDSRARQSISLTTIGTNGPATYSNVTGVFNIPNYSTDLTGYVPYTGANQTVNLNTQQLQAGHTTLTTNGSTETLTINHTSGSGKAINVTKGGNGEGLYIDKTSGSGNAATIVGTLEATTLVKTGGTSSQFLKADGSVDSTAYGTVSSVAALTLGTSGTDLSSSVVNSTTTPVITLNVPTASAVNRGALSAADWTTFNSKQNAITLTTTGTSGPATLIGSILNIPEYQGGVTSFNGRTGAITLTSGDVTTALGFNPVTDARTLTINGETYDLTANRSWTVGINPSARDVQTYIATAGQTVFTVTGGYTVGLVDVFINGVRLTSSDYTATNGTTVVLAVGTSVGNIVDIIKYTSGIVNSVSGSGTTNELAYFTGSTTIASLTTATYPSLTELSYVKGVTSSIQNQLDSKQSAISLTTTGDSGASTLIANVLNVPAYTLSGLGGVPSTRTITINGTTQDLSDDRTYNVGTVTSVTASSPLFSSGGTTPNITIQQATNLQSGFLYSGDWITFNNKENAISAGTTAQYFRGDKTFQTLNTAVVPESGNLYYTDARSRAALSFAAGSGAYNSSTGVITIPTNNNQITNGAGYITSSALGAYLPLAGGTLTGLTTFQYDNSYVALNRSATNRFIGLLYETASTNQWFVGLRELGDNNYYIYNEILGTNAVTINISNNTVTANRYSGYNTLVLNTYTTVNPSSNVYLYSPPSDRDAWIYLDSADTGSNWGVYHRQIDTDVSGLPQNSIGFIGGGSSILQAYISLLNGNGYFRGNLSAANLSGTNTGNVTIGTANGLSLSGQALSLGLASGSANGALSSTDWTTFNNKQAAGNYVTTDTAQTITGQKTISKEAVNYGGTVQSFLIDGAATNGALTINSNGGSPYAYQTFAQGGVGKFEIGIVGTGSNGSLYINRNIQTGETGASIFIKKSNGFVGINNIDPSVQLDINGTARVSTSSVLPASFISSGNETIVRIQNTGPSGRDYFLIAGGNGGIFNSGQFGIYDATVALPRLSINSIGNLGIGIANPNYRLHVFQSGDNWHTVFDGGTGQLRFGAEAGAGAVIQARTEGGTTRPLYLQRDGNNVIIGGTADNGARLQVNGESRFTTNFNGFVARFIGGATSGVLGGFYANSTLGFASIGVQSGHEFRIFTSDVDRFSISSTGAATFSSSVTANGQVTITSAYSQPLVLNNQTNEQYLLISSAVAREAMTQYYNPTAGNWYTGIRSSTGIGSTSSYHIYSSTFGNDVFVLNTDGSGRFVGNVTLDSSTSGNRSMTIRASSGNSASLRLQNTVHDWDVNCQTNNRFAIFSHTDGVERLVIVPTTGNTLINTASDNGRTLRVNGRGYFDSNVVIVPQSEGWAEGLSFIMPTTNTWGGLRWRRERANNDGNWYVGFTALDSTDDLVFGVNNGGSQVDNIIRLTKSGNVKIGTATNIGPVEGKLDIQYNGLFNYGMNLRTTWSGGGLAISFNYSTGAQVGSINTTSSSTSYNTSSDYRLKQDLKDFNGLDLINKIKTYDFEWTTDKTRSYGVVAHELQEVINYAVHGQKDSEIMQGVDYSKLVPILIKAIQEQQLQIDKLKTT